MPNKNSDNMLSSILDKSSPTVQLEEGINLYVFPREEIKWNEFIKYAPRYSVALDGFVYGMTRFNAGKCIVNFNHHEEVDRMATRSTCAQVYMALRQGLMESFRENGSPKLNIFVNDSDQDVSLSVWLLQNHNKISGRKITPLINRLVFSEDILDTTAGAYPFDPNSKLMQELEWIFEPYTKARISFKLFAMNNVEIANTILSISSKIDKYCEGKNGLIPLDLRFEKLGGGKNWTLIKEIGAAARTGLDHTGIRAYISVYKNKNNSFTYSIGKMSQFDKFPIKKLYKALNNIENIPLSSSNSWGGGDIIGGSPRLTGSAIPPKEIEKIVNSYLESL
ncbi:MAG TPA: hypothetical protein QF753_02110 [Victivallales bacterium]|nr:hypothetical protein [Victivallales bacterium]